MHVAAGHVFLQTVALHASAGTSPNVYGLYMTGGQVTLTNDDIEADAALAGASGRPGLAGAPGPNGHPGAPGSCDSNVPASGGTGGGNGGNGGAGGIGESLC